MTSAPLCGSSHLSNSPPPYSVGASRMALAAILSYGRSRAARALVEAAFGGARIPRSDFRRDVMDRGGGDPLMGRVPNLAPGRAPSRPPRGDFRHRLARAECTGVSPRPSPFRQGRAFRPLRRSGGFRQGLPSGLVACLSWGLPASDGCGSSVCLPRRRRRLAPSSAAALTPLSIRVAARKP
jgi:hypothetical protein